MRPEIYDQMYNSEKDNWWYKSRRQLITDMVGGVKPPFGDGVLKILDVGCGTGLNSKSLEQFGYVYGIDMSEDALGFSKLRGKFNLTRAYAEALPIKDDVIYIICALDLLEHIEDDLSVINEFHRVLTPDGSLILAVPAFMFLWSGHDEVLHHKRRYDKKLLIKHLELHGFSVNKSTYWNCFLFPEVALMKYFRKNKYRKDGRDDLCDLPHILNTMLFNVLNFENIIIKYGLNLPFGVSILCVCRKTDSPVSSQMF